MGTTLQNGVYLPNEGERNCYAGLKTNWEILDQKVADVTALQQAVAGALHREIVESLPTTDIDPNTIYMILSGTSATENVYDEYMYVNNAWELIGTSATDLTNYYTKGDVDGLLLLKANASDLTSHTGDTTIHVTANDKTKWTNSANTHVLRLALSALTPSTSDNSFSNLDDSTALKVGDKVMDTAGVLFEVTAIDTQNSTFTIGTALIDLAQDSDVVHKSGDETVGGQKTFDAGQINVKSTIQEIGVIPQTSTLQYMPFMDKNNVIHGLVGLWDYDNGASEIQLNISDIFKNGVKDKTGTLDTAFFSFGFLSTGDKFTTFGGSLNNSLIPLVNSTYDVGSSSYKWKSINGLEPSSLSLPNLTNAVDISSYITDLTGSPNVYSPPANGYIVLRSTTANVLGIVENTTGMGSYSRGSNQVLAVNLPVVKNSSISIYAICSSLTHAKFIPCQGNV